MQLSIVFKALKASKIKTALIYLSLSVTLVSIFLITSISQGIISMYSSMLQNNGDIIVTQAKISDTFFSDVNISLLQKIKKIDGVKDTSALIVGAAPVNSLPIVAIYGVTPNLFKKYQIIKGNYPHKGEVIIGQSIANRLKDTHNIKISDSTFLVSGIFKSSIGFENGGIIMPMKSAQKIFHKSASLILINSNFKKNNVTLIKNIQALSPKIDVKSTQSFIKHYNQFNIIKKSSFLISLIAFIMGLIAIGSIMSITVLQRKDEFGIMKALGISSKKIVFFVILEGIIVGIAAFITAYLFSNTVLFIIKHTDILQGYVNGTIDFSLIVSLFFTTLAITILGSLLPAYQALKVDPVTLMGRGN